MCIRDRAKGNACFSAGNFEEAVKHYTDAIAIDAKDHVFYSNRSACLASLNRFEEALADSEQCIELKPDFAKAYSRKGAALHGLGKLQEATMAYMEGLKIDPNNAALQQGVQDVLRFAGASAAPPPAPAPAPKPKEPVKELTEEEKEDLKRHNEAKAVKDEGTTAYKAKDFDKAIELYNQAFEMYPKDISPLTNVAACLFEQDDFDGCIAKCMEAIEKGRENLSDFTLIAKAWVRIGNTHMRRAARAEGFELKEPHYKEAIEAYGKSLLEQYTNDAFDRQKKAKALMKKHHDAEYLDLSLIHISEPTRPY
eukprot:TRINITY_DN2762_c0_g1_i1.p1 TRINITY_DN2762_c0_g1~~TRINITY_DN2762_c0_g1_i1.p1  ORF type:complete len:310 (-),score=150.87 TRINITY_DN2762_c0_g1_i1:166-1095(-)